MKKITLLILLAFFSISGYAQFTPVTVEGFENTTGPDAPPGTNWTLGTGNWAVFDNGVGTAQRWGINSSVVTPPTPVIVYQGANSAYVNRENIGQGNTSEDFLATPLVNIPANGQLRFFTRMFTNNNQGTIYQIRVAPAAAVQTNPAAYATTVQTWTEVNLTTTFNIYEEKVVDLSAYAGTQIYVAFVKVYTQPLAVLDGDRWLVDNVSILERCLDPTALAANAITQTSADLSWGNPSGATSWEIEVLPFASAPTGVGVVYSGSLPFTATATATGTPFAPNTDYKYYVRAMCSNGANSMWVGPFAFSTTSPGFSCAAPIVIPTLPYNTTDNTSNYGDASLEGTPGAGCGSANNYLGGNDVVYSYTATTTGVINVTMTPTGTFSGIFAYASCADIGVNCLAGVANGNTNVRTFDLPVVSGSTYYFVISTWPAPQTTAYTLTIQVVNCPPPTTLGVNSLTQTSANLTWANPGGATSWEYVFQAPGAGIPSGAGTQTSSNTVNPIGGLTVNTPYEFYVRADCNNSTFSAWSGPFLFNTLCAAFTAPFQEGFNTGSPTESCWTVLNVNADGDTWDMNYVTNPFEGNQCAAINTDFNGGANNDWLISPQIILNGNQRLKFHYRVQSTFEPNDFRVMLSTNGPSPADFTTTLLPLTSYSNITYAQSIVSLAGISGPVNIGWHVPNGGLDGWRIFIDNVIIEEIPTCPEPSLLTASGVLAHEATIGWTNGGPGQTTWEIIYVPSGDPAPNAASTGIIVTDNPHTLTNLPASTCYDAYVRAVCPGNDLSPWTGPVPFCTQVEPPECGGIFTDPGGPNADYANNENSTVTICAPAGQVVTVTFSQFNTEPNWDGLYVYDSDTVGVDQISSTNGPGNNPTLLPGAYWGTAIPGPFTSTNADGCLTFQFGSDGSVVRPGWVATVTCGPAPNCAKPTALTATSITTTSALLGWTESNPLVTSWDIIIVPLGDPVPLPTDPGFFTVTNNPATITGLNPGTQYTFYVRANCPTEGESALSTGFNFNTLLANDECGTAIFAPVNSAAVCQQITPGSIAGATASASPAIAPCIGTADDDVWFQFIATNAYLNVALQNVVGTSTNLNFAVYSGQCGTLTQVFCSAAFALSGVLNDLTVGNTYYIRVYSNSATPQSTTFNLCISTPSTCPTAATVCSLTNYANTTGVTSLQQIGCLGTSPNPAYFTIQVATSGPINFLLTQSTTIGGAPNIDVDYAAWGPFTDQTAACNFIGTAPNIVTPGIGVPVTQQTGCSYSAAPTETLNITNALAGQYYIVLITNFSNQAGFINLVQSNENAVGAGSTLCCPDANFTYTPTVYCKTPGTPNPIPVIATSSVAGVFSSTIVPGLVFANTATGEIDLQASAPGNYIITNTVAATVNCGEKVKTFTISIVEPTAATISYSAASYCGSSTTPPQNVTFTGSTGGTYSATPNGGLAIDPITGTITPGSSAPGVYTIIYSLPGSGVCAGSNPTAQVEIIAAPTVAPQTAVSVCNTYTLPALPFGNYFAASGGVNPIDVSIPITSTQLIYVYANNGGCTDEESFTVTINNATAPTLNVTQPTCSVQTGIIEVTAPVGSGYQYSLDNGTYQSGTTFSGVAPGTHTVTVLDVASGCYSLPVTVIIDPVPFTPTELGFTYTTPICQNAAASMSPTLATGFTTGGTFSSTLGLNINPATGLITLGTGGASSIPGSYTVTYTVAPNNAICLAGGASTFNIVILPEIAPVTIISYDASPYCTGQANPLPNTGAAGFTTGGTFSATTGLIINPTTGLVDLTSPAGTYTVTYSITADAATCRVASSSTAQVVIAAPVQISVSGDCEGAQFVLTVSPFEGGTFPVGVTYLWENSTGASMGTTQSIVVTEPGTYTVTVTSNGCPNSSSIPVDAITCVIQKGISANNDGLNDSFDLTGFNVKTLSIFNRYGAKVYSKGDYTDQWKGQSDDGDELPDGTYYFVIVRDNGETKTGWIYINRAQ